MTGYGPVTKVIQEIVAKQKCPRGGTHSYKQAVIIIKPFPPRRGKPVTNYHETRCTKCKHLVSKLRTFGIY